MGDKVRQLLQSLIAGTTTDFQAQIAQSLDQDQLQDPAVNQFICDRLTELGIDVENLILSQPYTYQMF